jgi:hypothetical protein
MLIYLSLSLYRRLLVVEMVSTYLVLGGKRVTSFASSLLPFQYDWVATYSELTPILDLPENASHFYV